MLPRQNVEKIKEYSILTDLDFNRLSACLEVVDNSLSIAARDLEEKLALSAIVDAQEAPSDLVTMNSKLRYRLLDHVSPTLDSIDLTLVYPKDANIEHNQISVLSPVGRAILGRKVGEIVKWRGNDGQSRHLRLEEIEYQPEKNGDWHL